MVLLQRPKQPLGDNCVRFCRHLRCHAGTFELCVFIQIEVHTLRTDLLWHGGMQIGEGTLLQCKMSSTWLHLCVELSEPSWNCTAMALSFSVMTHLTCNKYSVACSNCCDLGQCIVSKLFHVGLWQQRRGLWWTSGWCCIRGGHWGSIRSKEGMESAKDVKGQGGVWLTFCNSYAFLCLSKSSLHHNNTWCSQNVFVYIIDIYRHENDTRHTSFRFGLIMFDYLGLFWLHWMCHVRLKPVRSHQTYKHAVSACCSFLSLNFKLSQIWDIFCWVLWGVLVGGGR